MFKFLKDRKKKDNKGFTLVELVIVIAILAILVGLLAPQYTKYVEKSRKSADASNLENMVRAIEIAAADTTGTLEPATYTIKINDSGTSVNVSNDNDNKKKTAAENILKNTISNDVLATKLKSKDWKDGSGDTVNDISAIITINDEYTTTVSYTPDKFYTVVGKNQATLEPSEEKTQNDE